MWLNGQIGTFDRFLVRCSPPALFMCIMCLYTYVYIRVYIYTFIHLRIQIHIHTHIHIHIHVHIHIHTCIVKNCVFFAATMGSSHACARRHTRARALRSASLKPGPARALCAIFSPHSTCERFGSMKKHVRHHSLVLLWVAIPEVSLHGIHLP